MIRKSSADATRILAGCWRRWTRTVRYFARRQAARFWLDPARYQALRNELLNRCVEQATLSDGAQQELLREMIDTVTPWVTLGSLAQTHHATLQGILQRAERLQERLEGRPGRDRRGWKAIGLRGVAVAILGILPAAGVPLLPAERCAGWVEELQTTGAGQWLAMGIRVVRPRGKGELTVMVWLAEAALITPLLMMSGRQH
jgi:hypothetical protein